MAEGIFRSLTKSDPRISHVDSAGTGAYHTGDSPDSRTITTLEDNGIVDYDHAARKVHHSDFVNFDYIMAMDRDNLRDLQRLRQRLPTKGGERQLGKVMLFGDFGGRKGEEVMDPYYGGRDGFEVAYEQLVRCSKGFLRDVLGSGDTL